MVGFSAYVTFGQAYLLSGSHCVCINVGRSIFPAFVIFSLIYVTEVATLAINTSLVLMVCCTQTLLVVCGCLLCMAKQ